MDEQKKMEQAVLKVKNLCVSFPERKGEKEVIKGISFEVKAGEMVGIVGESGSGKSMTSLSIMRLLKEDAIMNGGEIWFEDRDLLKLSKDEMNQMRGKELAMIFQEPMTSLNPVKSIGRQIEEVLELHTKLVKEEREKQVDKILEEVGLPSGKKFRTSYPHQLSGGMRQRVMIAMAMIMKPKLLIADEPTTALDVTVQAQILALLNKLNEQYHTTILLISHDLGIIKTYCNRGIVMCEGKIVEEGDVQQLMNHPNHDYTKKLLEAVPTMERLNQFKEESSDTLEVEAADLKSRKEMVQVDKVSVFYSTGKKLFQKKKRKEIVKDVSLTIKEGEIVGIVGESGSGKTTLSKAIAGLVKDTEGVIDLAGNRPAMVFQDPYSSLNPSKKIGWILEEPLKIQGGYSKAEREKKVEEMLGHVGLPVETKDRYISQLSGGQRQRVSIASALIGNAKLILLDEPVSIIDPNTQEQIDRGISRLIANKTTFVVTHAISTIMRADKILVLRNGKLIASGTHQELLAKNKFYKKLVDSEFNQAKDYKYIPY